MSNFSMSGSRCGYGSLRSARGWSAFNTDGSALVKEAKYPRAKGNIRVDEEQVSMREDVDESTDFRPGRTHDLRRAHALISAVGVYLPLSTLAKAFVVEAEDDKARLGFGPSKLRAALAVDLSDKEVEIRDAVRTYSVSARVIQICGGGVCPLEGGKWASRYSRNVSECPGDTRAMPGCREAYTPRQSAKSRTRGRSRRALGDACAGMPAWCTRYTRHEKAMTSSARRPARDLRSEVHSLLQVSS
jgi:hypothetical protein